MRQPDPENLINDRPALVDLTGQGPVFVADASTRENGWLRLKEWSGTSVKLPPHRVNAVRYLEVERYGDRRSDGLRSKRIADREWREEAKDRPQTNGEQPVVADD